MPTLYMDDADLDEEEAPQDSGQPQEGGKGPPAAAGAGGGPPAAAVGPPAAAGASVGPARAGRPEGQENASAGSITGAFTPGTAEATHLAKARKRLEAARVVAQAAGVGGQDDQDDQDKQPKPKSKGRGGGRGRGRGRPKGKATAKETERPTVQDANRHWERRNSKSLSAFRRATQS